MAKINYRVWLLAIFIVTIAVYFGVAHHEFASDDYPYLAYNPYIKDLSWAGIKAIFSNYYFSNYHPITSLTWAIEYKIWQMNPMPYHITNLLLHLVNTLLVFVFFKKLVNSNNVALICAALFALHPMHVEVVAWVAQRKDLVYTAFFLLSLIFYVQFTNNKKVLIYVCSVLFFILSLLSKSMAITLPVLLVLIDYYRGSLTAKSLINKIPFFVLSLGFGILTLKTQEGIRFDKDFTPVFPFVDRIFLVCYAVCLYLYDLIVPTGLALFHFYPVKTNGSFPMMVYASPFILILIGVLITRIKSFRKELIFGFLFFLISISIVLQFVPAGCAIISERYTYVPYLGCFFIIAMFYDRLQAGAFKPLIKFKALSNYVLICFIGLLAAVALVRVGNWENYETLLDDLVAKEPDNPYSYFSRSHYLLEFKQDPKAALADIQEAIKLDTTVASSYSNCGFLMGIMRDYPGSVRAFDMAIKLDSSDRKYHMNRGISRMMLPDYKGALADFNIWLAADSSSAEMVYDKAFCLYHLGDTAQAAVVFNKALALNPKYVDAYYQLGTLYFLQKDYKKAIQQFSSAIALKKDYTDAYYNRAAAKFNSNDPGACDDIRMAMSLGQKVAPEILAKCK